MKFTLFVFTIFFSIITYANSQYELIIPPSQNGKVNKKNYTLQLINNSSQEIAKFECRKESRNVNLLVSMEGVLSTPVRANTFTNIKGCEKFIVQIGKAYQSEQQKLKIVKSSDGLSITIEDPASDCTVPETPAKASTAQ